MQLPPPSYTDQLAANIGGAAANGGQSHGGQRAALEQHAALDQHLEAELQRQQQEHDILQRQLVHFPWPAPLLPQSNPFVAMHRSALCWHTLLQETPRNCRCRVFHQVKQHSTQLDKKAVSRSVRVQVSMEQGGGPGAAPADFSQAPLSYPMPAEQQVGPFITAGCS